MAASLPVLLLLTDYFTGRKINIKTLLEKVPFIALSIVLGVFAVMAQDKGGSIDVIAFPFPLRIVFACYGFCSYLLKLILPLKLSSYYPYPIESGVDIPGSYYTAVLFVLGLAVYIFYSLRFSRKIFFGLGFFAVTIFLVLQLLPVGGAMMADRYSYIPSIGVFYLAGGGFYLLWNKKLKWIAIIMLCFFTVLFSVKTYARCGVWKNSLSLWNDVIKQYQTVSIAYYNRGAVYADRKEFEQALADYTKAIQLKPGYLDAYVNRGNIFRDKKMDEEAIQDYIKAIQLQPDFPTAYFNRGTVFMNEKRTDEALNDFDMAIKLKPDFTDAYYNQGNVFFDEKKYEDAISSYTKAINLKTDYASSYYNRGLAEYYSGEKNAACIDLKHAGSLGHHQALEASNKLCN
jgi:Tfp pilus assembly protein PilF